MKRISTALRKKVQKRAEGRCEYCRFPEALSELRFVVDHIRSRQHLGRTALNNLAWCCPFCNRHKGPNVGGVDPLGGTLARLFNPRNDRWKDHFRCHREKILGKTPEGRVTIITLAFNHSDQLDARLALLREGILGTD